MRAERLDALWDTLGPGERSDVDAEAADRLQAELPFLYRAYEAAKAAGVSEREMPVAVRSTLRAHRHDLLDEREQARGEEARATVSAG